MADDTAPTESGLSALQASRSAVAGTRLHLTVVWSSRPPYRIGETCAVTRSAVFGRGAASRPGDPPKLELVRQRPGANEPTGALEHGKLSRRQWLVEPDANGLRVQNVGRQPLLLNGVPVPAGVAREGDTLGVAGVVLCVLERRPPLLAPHPYEELTDSADAHGIVGESAAVWKLRHDIVLVARSEAHCLVSGESGAGKELAARAVHQRSACGHGPFVSRSAATIPEGLVEAELFGNVANYPNVGTPARQGLVGTAHGGTLFLDELGELSEAQQANLLRVLDAGEYQRLGEDRPRTSRFRLIAATNRPLTSLKHDLLARFSERITVPGLGERRADVPLLLASILRTLGEPDRRVHPELLEQLVRHRYSHHFRELDRLVRLAKRGSAAGELALSDEVQAELDPPVHTALTEAEIRAALAATPSATEAAKRLGLPSRFALYRLVKRLGMEA